MSAEENVGSHKLKIGIIGCGDAWDLYRARLLETDKNFCELIAFCDIIPERVIKTCIECGAPGAKAYLDYRELLANPDVEMFSVFTSKITSEDLAAAAMDANRSISLNPPDNSDTQKLPNIRKPGKRRITYYVTQPAATQCMPATK